MNQNHSFSVVVPFHNVRIDQAEKCLKSLLAQDPGLLREIVVVDDGSDEKSSGEIAALVRALNTHTHTHTRRPIKLIRQENRGLAGARKTGFENSEGEIVCFVDSDDWILSEGWVTALNGAFCANPDADLVIFGWKEIGADDQTVPGQPEWNEPDGAFRLDYGWYFKNHAHPSRWPAVWKYAYRRTILQNNAALWKCLKLPFEDVYFTACVIQSGYRATVLNEAFYAYRSNNANSISARTKACGSWEKLRIFDRWFNNPDSEFSVAKSENALTYWVWILVSMQIWLFEGFRKSIEKCQALGIYAPKIDAVKKFYRERGMWNGKFRKIWIKLMLASKTLDSLLAWVYRATHKELFRKVCG